MKWVLDAGHGGSDPGAVGSTGLKESDVALKIVLKLKELLQSHGETVILTRDKDIKPSFAQRCSYKSDYFISVHCNSAVNKEVSGTETLVASLSSYSFKLAKKINDNLSKVLNSKNRGIKERKDLYVLKHTSQPAMLIEIDFISNVEVEQKMKSDEWINKVASSICTSILEHIGKEKIKDYQFTTSIEKLSSKGYINSKDYWLNNSEYSNDFFKELIIKVTKKHCFKDAIEYLTEICIINLKEYWLNNNDFSTENIRSMIIKIANEI